MWAAAFVLIFSLFVGFIPKDSACRTPVAAATCSPSPLHIHVIGIAQSHSCTNSCIVMSAGHSPQRPAGRLRQPRCGLRGQRQWDRIWGPGILVTSADNWGRAPPGILRLLPAQPRWWCWGYPGSHYQRHRGVCLGFEPEHRRGVCRVCGQWGGSALPPQSVESALERHAVTGVGTPAPQCM